MKFALPILLLLSQVASAQLPISVQELWYGVPLPAAISSPCVPNLPSGTVMYYDVLCPSSVILNSTNTALGYAVMTWQNLTGNHMYDLTNNLEDYVNNQGGSVWITGAVWHASGSLNSNSTANIFFDRQLNANGLVTLNQALQLGTGTNVPQPFTFLFVFQNFAQTNGNIVNSLADFNGGAEPIQDSVTINTTPNSRLQVFHGGGGIFYGGFNFGTNWTVLTCVCNGTSSYMRTNGSLYFYGDAGTTNFIATNHLFTIGPQHNSVGWFAAGRFGVWNRELNTNELQWIETNSFVFLK